MLKGLFGKGALKGFGNWIKSALPNVIKDTLIERALVLSLVVEVTQEGVAEQRCKLRYKQDQPKTLQLCEKG